ncbi:MAG TPA: hypothetical protein VM243_06425 [Phycisphaerae bacterium]|nr:hypothetical protein [Phycisphaerae bacterium]
MNVVVMSVAYIDPGPGVLPVGACVVGVAASVAAIWGSQRWRPWWVFRLVGACTLMTMVAAVLVSHYRLLAVAALAAMVNAAVSGWMTYRRRPALYGRLEAGRCLHCGYDLTGNVSGVCPECGEGA